MSDAAFVTPQFIEENQSLFQRRNGGPVTKKERFERREQVYKLHFEQGYPALKVAKKLNVNRHTIEADIKFWYSKLTSKWRESEIEGWMQKQVERLEIQRTRLIENLEGQEDPKQKVMLEKMIAVLDEKIVKIVITILKHPDNVTREATSIVNAFLKEHKINGRYIDPSSMKWISIEKYDKIQKILEQQELSSSV
jgi:hypothetical protein